MKVTDLIILLFISIVSASKLTDKLFKEKNHIVNGERNAYVCTAGVGMMAAGVIAYVLDNRDFTFESFSKISNV
ncbi:hypothetical protein KGF54_005183 [Candida jiufengensis]|uniref:uncharacterized protein n=1 Tax=Candida jiufengensis TaxID=497108 RepID=UPI002225B3DC|nr:uncharacterized protein KGF54_005183 [Candida jiufengensis]KAI5950366.1 hypothetical protein KGF54_005183 [Candida jiufengensis]